MPVDTVIKSRAGTAAQWTSANPVLALGEMGLETDTQRSKFGDASTAWASLSYSVGDSSGVGAVEWTSVTGKPTTFAPSAHTHLTSEIADITSTAAELNILDGVTATSAELNILDGVTATATELNILDGVTSTAAELNILDGVTATATELNILDGVTATSAELNYVDGVTSGIQTQLDGKAAAGGGGFETNFLLMGA